VFCLQAWPACGGTGAQSCLAFALAQQARVTTTFFAFLLPRAFRLSRVSLSVGAARLAPPSHSWWCSKVLRTSAEAISSTSLPIKRKSQTFHPIKVLVTPVASNRRINRLSFFLLRLGYIFYPEITSSEINTPFHRITNSVRRCLISTRSKL